MEIAVLNPSVAAQIAAGEVVERPASVVKELVENAIDAGATDIKVSIEQGGTQSMEVTDNGNGIPEPELMLAFSRHATSKLRTAEDLTAIQTLGFRGEALPSIAAVSLLTCKSRTKEADSATQVKLRYGEQQREISDQVGRPPGTTIRVDKLFSNQPARLKFLKTKPTEAAQVQRVVTRYAMAYPQIRFQYVNDGRESFITHGTGDLRETMLQIWGSEVASKMLPVRLESPDTQVDGYVGNTDLHRSNRNDISITVNGRWVQDSNLAWAVEKGYSNSLPVGRRPIAVIQLMVPTNLVDVNAHPTKQEVRFRHESKVFAAVQRAVQDSLSAHGTVHQAASRPFGGGSRRSYRGPAPDLTTINQDIDTRHPADVETGQPSPTLERTSPSAPVSRPDDARRSTQPIEDPLVTTDLQAGQSLRDTIPELRLVGQAQLTFILADGPDGLYVLDQHAAHERVIFDRVFHQRTNQPADSQNLMIPERATLDEFQHETLVQHLELIKRQGFQLQHLNDLSWQINALPLPLAAPHCARPDHALQRLLDEFAAEQLVSSPHQAIAATIACHSATRAGDFLNEPHMQAIIDQLANTPEPHHCPHGRPTIIHLSKLRLDQEFRRR